MNTSPVNTSPVNKSFVMAGLAALITIGAFSGAQADPADQSGERWPRWYIGLSGGYTYMADQDISGGNTFANKMSLKNGYGVGGSIGYLPSSSMPLLNALRFEGEVTYHRNGVDKFSGGGTSVAGSGGYNTTAYMVNAFYDLPTNSPWSPYIGGGIGVATVHISNNPNIGVSGGDDNEFAYQGLIGIGYTPDNIPNTQWTLGYRYLATSDANFSTTGSSDISSKYSSNSVEIGAKFRF